MSYYELVGDLTVSNEILMTTTWAGTWVGAVCLALNIEYDIVFSSQLMSDPDSVEARKKKSICFVKLKVICCTFHHNDRGPQQTSLFKLVR